jgi:hypothetical protein
MLATRFRRSIAITEQAVHKASEEASGLLSRALDSWRIAEEARLAKMSLEERAKYETARTRETAEHEADRKRRKEHPHFGDVDLDADAYSQPDQRDLAFGLAAYAFKARAPGVISIGNHFATILADGLEVPDVLLDALAELLAVEHVVRGVGVAWKPSSSTGPQYPEWPQHVWFLRKVYQVATSKAHETSTAESIPDCLQDVRNGIGDY